MLDEVEQLSGPELLARVRELTRMDNRTSARLVAHLSEIDARELYVAEGFSSPFMYCTQVLHFSESTAYRRIEAGRAVRRFPVILDRIADGSIHLTGVTLLSPHLTAENHLALLESAKHRTRRQIEKLLAALNPERANPQRASIIPLPRRAPDQRAGSRSADSVGNPARHAPIAGTLALFESGKPTSPAGGAMPDVTPAARPATSQDHGTPDSNGGMAAGGNEGLAVGSGGAMTSPAMTSADQCFEASTEGTTGPPNDDSDPPATPDADDEPGQYRMHVTITEATRARLERAQHLMSHINPTGDIAVVLDRALVTLIAVLERRRFGRRVGDSDARQSTGQEAGVARPTATTPSRPPRETPASTPTAPGKSIPATSRGQRGRSRYIPSPVRRAVWRRDEGQCAFVGRSGHRCTETELLEFHHIVPWARGGASSTANLTLRCWRHNAHEAETAMGTRRPRTRTGASRHSERQTHPASRGRGKPPVSPQKE
jgi:hypothetical protein